MKNIKYKVIKDIIPPSWAFRPTCRVGEILHLSSGMLFNSDNDFICDIGSPIEKEYTKKIEE